MFPYKNVSERAKIADTTIITQIPTPKSAYLHIYWHHVLIRQ